MSATRQHASLTQLGGELEVEYDAWIGRRLNGRYRVFRKLGEGGMGTVYAARDLTGRRDVAVKVLRADFAADADMRRRFIWEACIIANLRHPNGVEIYDFGELTSGGFFIAMEYLDGETLAERATRQPLSYEEIFAVMQPILDVLQAAHAQGLVHRDLKPGNILLARRKDGVLVPKLIDFGIAKQTDDDATRVGVICGTPAYMSPEQAAGGRVDASTDVYALGAVLYCLIAGRPPFEGESGLQIARAHIHATPPSLTGVRGITSLPRELEALILQALDKSPARRPRSILEILRRLEGIRDRCFTASLLARVPAAEAPGRTSSDSASTVMARRAPPTGGARAFLARIAAMLRRRSAAIALLCGSAASWLFTSL